MKYCHPVKPRPYGSTPDVILRAYDQVGGAKRVEVILDRRASQIAAYAETPDCERAQRLSFAQARQLSENGASVFAEALAADCGGYFTPAEASPERIERLAAEAAREEGALIADFLDWLERARASAARGKLAADLDRLIATLVAMRQKVRS